MMGVDIYGWVIRRATVPQGFPLWFKVINIGSVVDVPHEYEKLFYGPNIRLGIPEGIQPELKEELEKESAGADTRWISWKEIKEIKNMMKISGDWAPLFELTEILAKHYGDEDVRMVVWFD